MITYTVKVYENRTEWFNEQGQLHRTDGPAVEWADGSKYWYLNGKRHREDGPAVEFANGTKEWWVNDLLHRTDGPAVEWADGNKEWWIDGTNLTEEEFLARTTPTCEGKVVEIDGKKYRLIAEDDDATPSL